MEKLHLGLEMQVQASKVIMTKVIQEFFLHLYTWGLWVQVVVVVGGGGGRM